MKTILLIATALLLAGCSTHYPNKNPLGEVFVSASGQNLAQQPVQIPDDFKGEPTLLLLGYKQDAQFDIDRWLIGLDMTQTEVKIYEVPTIQGMLPGLFADQIDSGMRSGIPRELWEDVVTVYDDGDKIQEFTGNEKGNNSRVVLLDEHGTVRYFYDRGFSVSALNNLRETLQSFK